MTGSSETRNEVKPEFLGTASAYPKSGRASCSRDASGTLQGWFPLLGRGDRLCHLNDWVTPVLHKRHADPKRLGAAGVRGALGALKHGPCTILHILKFGLTRPITEDHDGDCTDQGVSVLSLFIVFPLSTTKLLLSFLCPHHRQHTTFLYPPTLPFSSVL